MKTKKILYAFVLALMIACFFIWADYQKNKKLYFVVEMNSSTVGNAQVFFDLGDSYNESDSSASTLIAGEMVKYRFIIPRISDAGLKSIRFDLSDRASILAISNAQIENDNGELLKVLPITSFTAGNQIETLKVDGDLLIVQTTQKANDPGVLINNSLFAPATTLTGFVYENLWHFVAYLSLAFIIAFLTRYYLKVISSNMYSWIYIILALFYISSAMHFPVSIYTGAGHDDAWFLSNAEKILAGQWLGAFNQMTLIKGLGYSYILALNNLMGVPITLTLAIIYLIACFFFISVLRKIGLDKITALIIFALLIFQPSLFPTRIIRDNVYFSLLLISLSGLLYASVCDTEKHRIKILVSSGLCFGMFWITREEGVWVLPGFAAIILFFLYKNRKVRGKLKLVIKSLLIYFFFSLVFPVATAFVNYFTYDSFQNVDFKNPSFVSAINALNKVDIGKELQYLPVSQKKRAAIYKVSPAFRELEPYLEDEMNGWKDHGCATYEHTCGDYAGGWFVWALRDGAASLGYYKNPTLAASYFERIAEEIKSACNNGLLKCSINVIPFMPRLNKDAFQSIPIKIIEAIKLTIYKTPIAVIGGPSWGPIDRLETIHDFLGNPKIVSPGLSRLHVSGWYYSPRENWISLKCHDTNNDKIISIDRHSSPDIAVSFKDEMANYQRFSFKISDFEKCRLLFSNSEIKEIQLADVLTSPPDFLKFADEILHFDVFQEDDLAKGYKLHLKETLIGFYSSFSVYLFLAGSLFTFATIVVLIYLKRGAGNLIVITLSLWILYYARISIVVLVDVSSFPAINNLYLMPAFPLWTAASLVGIASFINIAKSFKKLNKV
jgi:hypothetical protein